MLEAGTERPRRGACRGPPNVLGDTLHQTAERGAALRQSRRRHADALRPSTVRRQRRAGVRRVSTQHPTARRPRHCVRSRLVPARRRPLQPRLANPALGPGVPLRRKGEPEITQRCPIPTGRLLSHDSRCALPKLALVEECLDSPSLACGDAALPRLPAASGAARTTAPLNVPLQTRPVTVLEPPKPIAKHVGEGLAALATPGGSSKKQPVHHRDELPTPSFALTSSR